MNKNTQIIWGIGKGILVDFSDATKIIAFANMQDLSVSSTANEEDIVGGNKSFPIATFPTDKEITISGTNSDFDTSMLEFSDGATYSAPVTKPDMKYYYEFLIPVGGAVTLPKTPVADTVKVIGFEEVESVLATGKFTVGASSIAFHVSDEGKLARVLFEYTPTTTVDVYEIFETSIAKPFTFTYLFPIYNDDNDIVANGQLEIYKAKMTSGANFSWSHRTASAPAFEAKALDPKRPDKKLWDIKYEEVTA